MTLEAGEPLQPLDPVQAAAAPPVPRALPVRFTGKGGEYFRIWIVNLLLTIATLGIYSAWAKVRKTRYLWANTQLDGVGFQYHGSPGAILRGRLVVGALFVAYSVAGRISIRAGLVAAGVLAAIAPWLFYKAMRFKLTNTTWRGVRFGFQSTVGEAYRALGPAGAVWLVFIAAAASVKPGQQPGSPAPFILAYLLFLALFPWFHARIKRYQHCATTWGSQRFELDPSTGAFYGLYGKTFAVALGPLVLMGVVFGVTVGAFAARRGADQPPPLVPLLVGVYAAMILFYAFAGSYFSARLQRLVWARTHGGPFRFSTTIRARSLVGLWLKNGLLTLLTLGLFWPYAAVAIARYQLECMAVNASAPPDTVAAGSATVEGSAAGDGAVDFFGWDLGL